ncbi:MAG: hypothetical protein U0Y68_14105 [Blastocatellia bacterium]
MLDVVFGEDHCRVRTGHAAENFALLRRLANSLLQQEDGQSGYCQQTVQGGAGSALLAQGAESALFSIVTMRLP